MTLATAIKYFRSYGLKCDDALVKEWLNSTALKSVHERAFVKMILTTSMNGAGGKVLHMKKG